MTAHDLVSRRQALTAAAGLGAAIVTMRSGGTLAASAGDADARITAFDLSDPIDNREAVVKMMGSNDGSVTFGHVSGRLHGMRPGEHAIPLVDFDGCAARVFRRREDGDFDLGLREWLFFRDMESGEPITTLMNPWTREEVELRPFRGGGGLNHTFGTYGQVRNGRPEYESGYGPFVYDWMVDGEDAVVQIDKFISFPAFYSPERFPRASTGPTRWEIQVQTLSGPLAELQDESLPAVRTREIWIMKNRWMGFMNMGQWSGHHIWRGMGKKALSVDELPADFQTRTEQVFPGLLDEVAAWNI